MGLKLKCNVCGLFLDFDIQNSLLILVKPCEDCKMQNEEPVAIQSAKFPGEPDDVLEKGLQVQGPSDIALTELTARVKDTREGVDGTNDDNDPKNVRNRE